MKSSSLQLHHIQGEGLLQALSDPAWIHLDGKVLASNALFQRLFGAGEGVHGFPMGDAPSTVHIGQHMGQLSQVEVQLGSGLVGHLCIFRPRSSTSERLQQVQYGIQRAENIPDMLKVVLQAFPACKGVTAKTSTEAWTAGEVVQEGHLAVPLSVQQGTLYLAFDPGFDSGFDSGFDPHLAPEEEKLLLQATAGLLSGGMERLHLQQAHQKLLGQQEETIARLQAILDNAPVGIGLRNTDLKIELVNRKATEYNQRPAEIHQNRAMNEIFPGAFEKVERMLRQVLDTGEPLLDVELTDQDLPGFRKGHHWQLNYFPVKTPDGRILGVGSIIQDITQRKTSELQLRESQHFLQRIADTVPTLIYIYDLQRQKNIYFNRELESILGYTSAEIEQMDQTTSSGLLHPDELPDTLTHYQQLVHMKPGDILSREYRMKHKNGQWRWLYTRETIFSLGEDGQVLQFLGGAIDITDWKEAQQALQESEKRFQLVADRAPVMIWMADPEGNAIFHNQSWAEFTGRPPEEDLGMGWMDLMHPEDRLALMDNFMDPERLKEPFESEYRMRRHDGVYRWVVDRGTPRYTPQGRFVGFIGACIDIHDRKVAEEQVQQSEQKLRELSEAQKRFVADAAHELRTPLTSIQGNLDLFTRFPNIPEDEKKEILRDVQREATRLGRLVNDMLQLARGDSGAQLRLDHVNLHQVVVEVWRDLERVSPNHQMQLLQLDDIELLGDPDRLKQLVLILLENALKYTPAGGQVSLSLSLVNDHAELRVSDSGVGIAEEDLEKVFERFYRADQSRHRGEDPGGTGLGLSIARWIVEQHGGHIRLESQLGVGTTVIVTLPIQLE